MCIKGAEKSCTPSLLLLKQCFSLVLKFWRKDHYIKLIFIYNIAELFSIFAFFMLCLCLSQCFSFAATWKHAIDWYKAWRNVTKKVIKCLYISIFSRWRAKKGSTSGIVSWREYIIYIYTFAHILGKSAFCRSNI